MLSTGDTCWTAPADILPVFCRVTGFLLQCMRVSRYFVFFAFPAGCIKFGCFPFFVYVNNHAIQMTVNGYVRWVNIRMELIFLLSADNSGTCL
jgi:hypothetical protein